MQCELVSGDNQYPQITAQSIKRIKDLSDDIAVENPGLAAFGQNTSNSAGIYPSLVRLNILRRNSKVDDRQRGNEVQLGHKHKMSQSNVIHTINPS